jgi:hypothetical protein
MRPWCGLQRRYGRQRGGRRCGASQNGACRRGGVAWHGSDGACGGRQERPRQNRRQQTPRPIQSCKRKKTSSGNDPLNDGIRAVRPPQAAHILQKSYDFLIGQLTSNSEAASQTLFTMTRESDERCDLNHPITQVTIFHRPTDYECNVEIDGIKHQNGEKSSIWNLPLLYNPRKRFQNSLKEGLPWRRIPPPELARTAACAKTREHRGLSALPRWFAGKAPRVRRLAGRQTPGLEPAASEPAECCPAERSGPQ